MKGLIYLYQRTITNRVKKALKRPVTYIMAVFILLYVLLICNSLNMMVEDGNFGSAENFVTILSILVFVLIPSNLVSYAKRKGLLFRPSEVHFVFSSPVSPNKVWVMACVFLFKAKYLLFTSCFKISARVALVPIPLPLIWAPSSASSMSCPAFSMARRMEPEL